MFYVIQKYSLELLIAFCYREWEDLESMGIARIQPGVATLGGKVYAVGGEQGSQILANGEVYDPKVTIFNTIYI